MFTGIIEALGRIKNIEPMGCVGGGDMRLHVDVGSLDMSDVQHGDSIAVNGVCLTAVEFDNKHFVADVSNETIALTSLKDQATGSEVNLEKAHSALTDTKGFIKPAILVASGLTKDAADQALTAADGNLRHVLGELGNC